ncbi:MAG TPA: hypothetical protein VK369_00305 [Segetibacter sp.]|nr:hypothetical protein [Segetibacter sp.]
MIKLDRNKVFFSVLISNAGSKEIDVHQRDWPIYHSITTYGPLPQ